MEEENKEKTNYSKLKWLQRIQEQNWEPEILISGIVLYALFQLPDVIREFFQFLDTYSFAVFSSGTADEVLSAVLLTANYWLIIGFTTHLIFRSVWVAFVGLSYVYKDGVRLDQLKFKERFQRSIEKNSNYVENILKLEKACSSVFAISFLLFMSVLGAFFCLTVVVGIIALLYEVAPDFLSKNNINVDYILFVFFALSVIDFIGLGILKRIPIINKIYYPIYKLLSVLTLSPLYRNIYYGFISNHKKWKVAIAMAVFVISSFFIIYSIRFNENVFNKLSLRITDGDGQLLYHGHYMNLMGDNPSKRLQIPSDVIRDNVLPVFVVVNSGMQEKEILEQCNYDSLRQVVGIDLDSLKLECLSDFYSLVLDEDTLALSYLYHHQQKNKQEGLMTFVDISHLERGMHELELIYHLKEGPYPFAWVEFFKDAAPLVSPIAPNSKALLPQDSVERVVLD